MPFSDPERTRNYQREYRLRRRSGETCTTPSTSHIPESFRLQTAQNVIDLLEEQVEVVRAEAAASTLEKARTISFLAGVALKRGNSRDRCHVGARVRRETSSPGR